MIIFDDEYKLVLAFYKFEKTKSNDSKEITLFTDKMSYITHISRSPEIVRYMLSSYKKVDPQYNANNYSIDNKFKIYFEKYSNDIEEIQLKNFYRKFKEGLLDTVKDPLYNQKYNSTFKEDYPKEIKQVISREIQEYPRDNQVKINAFIYADFKCELNYEHETFIDRHGNKYMEGHHLIPLRFQYLFSCSLDVEANLICLCPNCHRSIHFGFDIDNKLKRLYNDRKARLQKCGLDISYDELKKMYVEGDFLLISILFTNYININNQNKIGSNLK